MNVSIIEVSVSWGKRPSNLVLNVHCVLFRRCRNQHTCLPKASNFVGAQVLDLSLKSCSDSATTTSLFLFTVFLECTGDVLMLLAARLWLLARWSSPRLEARATSRSCCSCYFVQQWNDYERIPPNPESS